MGPMSVLFENQEFLVPSSPRHGVLQNKSPRGWAVGAAAGAAVSCWPRGSLGQSPRRGWGWAGGRSLARSPRAGRGQHSLGCAATMRAGGVRVPDPETLLCWSLMKRPSFA